MDIFVMPIIGAIIGFFTNVLAIIMLFRPHEQIRLGRFPLPFTPGLIPRGRRDMAKKVGEVLGGEVLTPDVLIATVTSDEVVENLTKKISALAQDFFDDTRNIGQLAADSLSISQDELHKRVADWGHRLTERGAQMAQQSVLSYGKDGLSLGDALPQGLLPQLAQILHGRVEQTADAVQNIINHPKWGAFLRQTAVKIIKDNSKGLLGLLVNPDKIYDNLTESLVAYLKSEEGQGAVRENLDKLQEWVQALKIEDLPDSARDWAAATLSYLTDHIKQEELSERAATFILNLKPSQIITEKMRNDALGLIRPLVTALANKAGKLVVDSINIPKIVEEKINEMDTRDAEGIILAVAGKHLKWIAALGGILGFIIGFIPAMLNF